MNYEMVIGLEVHIQLNTKTKLFSNSPTQYGEQPNTQANLIDLAYPGTLPMVNRQAIIKAVRFGLSIGATIAPQTHFERKHYFYPDLPKGYQTSQLDKPIVQNGYLEIKNDGVTKRIDIVRAHLEEDAGKLFHGNLDHNTSMIDYNRAGIPLIEVVTTPCFDSAQEVVCFLKTLHQLVRYLDISNGNLQEGNFRCDVNLSLRPKGQTTLGTRTEIKNLNSFKYIEKAIQFESLRQKQVLLKGESIKQETRLYCSITNQTRAMRSKETEQDYRYFPCPDLLPIAVDKDFIEQVAKTLPELPEIKKERFKKQYNLSEQDASFLCHELSIAQYYESVCQLGINSKLASNWIKDELLQLVNLHKVPFLDIPITPAILAELLQLLSENKVSGSGAKDILRALWHTNLSPLEVAQKQGLILEEDSSAINATLEQLLSAHPEQAKALKEGKNKLAGFFVGQAMKTLGKTANPKSISVALQKILS